MWLQLKAKIMDWPGIQLQVSKWRGEGKSIAFTNGCFDLLHFGHVRYLADAKAEADVLIVGLNADTSVHSLKGPGRPIQDEQSRAHILASLAVVDAVVIFKEGTPLELIHHIRPDILLKGGDWKVQQIVGADFVISTGGQVKSLPFVDGHSTTGIEERILRNSKN